MEKQQALQLSALSLAFLGDAEYTLFVRKKLIGAHDLKSGGLQFLASKYVCAKAQAKSYDVISSQFSEEETELAKRCRNAHNLSKAKNVGLADYKKATALEGVIGYLSLVDYARAEEIMHKSMEVIEGELSNE